MSGARDWWVFGSELSPYALKLLLCCRHAGLPHRFLPVQGEYFENLRAMLRVQALKSGLKALTWPRMSEDDELPLVPYLLGPDGEILYDSTAVAEWLDAPRPEPQRLIPSDPLAGFVARLIDDYADECLLYVVHHQRWVVSARDNDAGARLAAEFRGLLGPLQPLIARQFSTRQVRRLPYLFSVAAGTAGFEDLPVSRRPPLRAGFPPTRALLEAQHARLARLLDRLLAQRTFLLGSRFTLADAAIYGQLAMNLSDPSTAAWLRAETPRLHAWLMALHEGRPKTVEAAEWQIDAALQSLLAEIARIHVPLMQQNAAAHARCKAAGQRRFNEAAFDRGEALYDGVLDGQPYRSVAKSFQARSWRDCRARWQALPKPAQDRLAALMPSCAAFAD